MCLRCLPCATRPALSVCCLHASRSWYRRAILSDVCIELKETTYKQEEEEHKPLVEWVKRQRIARQQRTLSQERIQILEALGAILARPYHHGTLSDRLANAIKLPTSASGSSRVRSL